MELNDTNTYILLYNGKAKVRNVIHLKKFFAPPTDINDNNPMQSDLDFNNDPKITGPMTQAMKKLLDHKNAVQLAINLLCDLTKMHCTMCEWEQDCSDTTIE
jgi:hypothetical protein